MQFVVYGYDGTDEGAPRRRQQQREAHLAGARKMKAAGSLLCAAALLGPGGGMTGSVMVVDFESEAALHSQWLDAEPYVVAGVWERFTVTPCKVPDFLM